MRMSSSGADKELFVGADEISNTAMAVIISLRYVLCSMGWNLRSIGWNLHSIEWNIAHYEARGGWLPLY